MDLIRGCAYYKEKWIYDGIPLTPDILLQCGIELLSKQTNWFKVSNNILITNQDTANKWYLYEMHEYDTCIPMPIKPLSHLHELQNVMYFITGNSLELPELNLF